MSDYKITITGPKNLRITKPISAVDALHLIGQTSADDSAFKLHNGARVELKTSQDILLASIFEHNKTREAMAKPVSL